LECGGLPPLSPRQTGRAPQPSFSAGYGRWRDQSGGKPPHSKVALCCVQTGHFIYWKGPDGKSYIELAEGGKVIIVRLS
jgi:hypothetical protein